MNEDWDDLNWALRGCLRDDLPDSCSGAAARDVLAHRWYIEDELWEVYWGIVPLGGY